MAPSGAVLNTSLNWHKLKTTFERDRATTGSVEKSKVQNRKILSSVAKLLKIEESELERSLTQRIVNAKGDSVKCALNTDEAQQAQKSFVKVCGL